MYQVLARKYRPRNFNELVGQNHVSRALTSALDRGRLHHAYLFTGTRGVGKTTIARILAKCLNCETGITSTPCETCATCKAVNEGRFIDLIEIDAASRTKVEDTRELLDNVPYAPTQGRFKVYLIDEVHMLSTHSFNALLKTLEEPPEHVKFLFATTDPQKLPITVISRCLQFTLRPLDAGEIQQHLNQILQKEQIENEADAIWQIAEAAQGSLRDALSLTDQAIAYGQGQVHHQDVKDMLGLIDRSIIYDLILAIHQNHAQKVSELLLQFRQQALDVALVLDQLTSTLHELALMQYLPDLSLKYSQEINQKIKQLAQLLSPSDLQLYYQISAKGRSELSWAVTQEQGFEMCVLRLLAFRPLQPNERVVSAVPPSSVLNDTKPQEHVSNLLESPIGVEKPQVNQNNLSNPEPVSESQSIETVISTDSVLETPVIAADHTLFSIDDQQDTIDNIVSESSISKLVEFAIDEQEPLIQVDVPSMHSSQTTENNVDDHVQSKDDIFPFDLSGASQNVSNQETVIQTNLDDKSINSREETIQQNDFVITNEVQSTEDSIIVNDQDQIH
ncbi:MAG: DNA polymerase III subunit gamma/tau, partial [Acinetobacter sp.]